MPPSAQDSCPSTPGKVKIDRTHHGLARQFTRLVTSCSSPCIFWFLFFFVFAMLFVLTKEAFLHFSHTHNGPTNNPVNIPTKKQALLIQSSPLGGPLWEKQVRKSCHRKRSDGLIVLVTGGAGFIGTHVSLALKKRGDGLVGLDSFNDYYDPSLKRARETLLNKHGVFVVDGDINDAPLLAKLFELVPFTHVMHLAAQAGVRYAIENPSSYVRSNVAGLVTLLEAAKSANPQPAFVWASSSSVYGLNVKVPFSESDRTDQPASLYAATKKAGEEITHVYNHIYGLSITGLRFFTVYGPWGRPDMAYFFFTRNILQGKEIVVYQRKDRQQLSRDFTYIDDVVQGCVAALDKASKSTGSGGKKKRKANYKIYNLGNTSPLGVPTLVNILERHLRVKARRNVVEMPANGDVPFTHANITLASLELGYRPTTDLQTGLKKFVNWYVDYYGYKSKNGGRNQQ